MLEKATLNKLHQMHLSEMAAELLRQEEQGLKDIPFPDRFALIEAVPDNGSYNDTVIMAHGFPDNFHSFDLCLEYMTNAGYRVLAPSLACFSKKSLPKDGDCTWANQAKYMMGFLDTIEEKIHYVGHDNSYDILRLFTFKPHNPWQQSR